MSDLSFNQYRLVIFDADDTLRETVVPGKPCPHAPEEWRLLPRVREILSRVPWGGLSGPRLGLASNQDHIGYGHLSEATARDSLAISPSPLPEHSPPSRHSRFVLIVWT